MLEIFKIILPHLLKAVPKSRYIYLLLICTLSFVWSSAAIYNRYANNQNHIFNTKLQDAKNLSLDLIKKCGDGAAISVGTISTTPNVDDIGNTSYEGRFLSAYAVENGDIDNLMSRDIYRKPKDIDQATYNLFYSLGTSDIRSVEVMDISNKDTGYYSIDSLIKITEWGMQNKLKKIYLTSVVKNDIPLLKGDVIFTVSLTITNYFQPKGECLEIINLLQNLRNDIKKLK